MTCNHISDECEAGKDPGQDVEFFEAWEGAPEVFQSEKQVLNFIVQLVELPVI